MAMVLPSELWVRFYCAALSGVLHRNYPTYRHAVRFGQVIESPKAVVFWFERYLVATHNATADVPAASEAQEER